MVRIPVPAGSLGASRVHTEWTVQAGKIHTASVWRLCDWTEKSVAHRCCRPLSTHITGQQRASGVGSRGPAEAAQRLRRKHACPLGGSTGGPSGRVPGGGAAFPALLLPCGFPASACVRLLPASTFREHLLPQVKSENVLLYGLDKRSSLAFSQTLHKKTKGKHTKKCVIENANRMQESRVISGPKSRCGSSGWARVLSAKRSCSSEGAPSCCPSASGPSATASFSTTVCPGAHTSCPTQTPTAEMDIFF